MKNNKSGKKKFNISIVKNHYCISLDNAGKRTQGAFSGRIEGLARTGHRY